MRNRRTSYLVVVLFILSVFGNIGSRIEVQADTGEYDLILPEADSHFYTKRELDSMPAQVLCYARNEIYARHGRIFKAEELKTYFELQSWYYGKIQSKDFSEDLLNEYEIKNIGLLSELEETLGENQYELNQDNYSFDEIDRYISSRKNKENREYKGIAENLVYEEYTRILQSRYLELQIPGEWEDSFGIHNSSEDSIEFYCKLAHQESGSYDGTLCSICRMEEYQPEEDFPNAVYIGEGDGYYYYFMRPADVRFDPEDPEGATLYMEMEEAAEEIIETIRIIINN